MVFYPKKEQAEEAHLDAKRMLSNNYSSSEVKKEIDRLHGSGAGATTLKDFDKKAASFKQGRVKKNNLLLGVKDTLDKTSFGIGNLQFINILMYILFPSFLLIGLLLSIRSFIVSRIEQIHNYTADIEKLKNITYWLGAGLGYVFIFMSFAVTFDLWIIFAILFILVGVLGAYYMKNSSNLSRLTMPRDKKGHYIKWIAYYGLPLTAIVMVLAGLIIDNMQEPMLLPMGETSITIYGYAVLFMLAGIMMILSSFFQSSLKEVRSEQSEPVLDNISGYTQEIRDPFITGLLIAGILFFSIQTAFNHMLGLYLYETYQSFTFVALLLAATLLAAFISPLFFDRSTIKKNGKSFILLFGTGLALFLPLLLTLSTHEGMKNYVVQGLIDSGAITSSHIITFMPLFYLIIGITGASVAGIAYSRITRELLQHEDKIDFSSKLGRSIGIGTSIFVLLLFLIRHFTGQFWISFLVVTLLYIISAVMFARLVSTKSEQEYQKRRFESRISHNKL